MMANLAGLAGVVVFGLVIFGFLELLDLFHVNGPQLPQWANRPVALFIAGFILSLTATAFWAGKAWYQRGKAPWVGDRGSGRDMVAQRGALFWVIVVGVTGVFFLASGFQTVGTNIFGQFCPGLRAGCWHPEWVAVGSGLVAVAYVLWRRKSS